MASPTTRPSDPRGECRAVAPLLARYTDPDLDEAERILLSTHLPRCPKCWARLQSDRWQDWQLRRLPGVILDPHDRCARCEQLAAAPGHPLRAGALRHGLSSLAVAAVAVLFFTSAMLARTPVADRAATVTGGPTGAAQSIGAATERLAQPLTANLLVTNPTRTIAAVGESAGLAGQAGQGAAANLSYPVAARNSAPAFTRPVTGYVRTLYAADGRWQLTLAREGGREETLSIANNTAIRLTDCRRGILSDLTVGTPIRVTFATDGAVQEIVVTR